MKAVSSPLQILDFAVTSFQFELVRPDAEGDVTSHFKEYAVDINFDMDKGDLISVFIKAEVNRNEERLPGYSLMAEVGCFFRFDETKKLSDLEKQNIEGYSTIYIALNTLRGLISSFTANAPFGRYILPSIDLNDLIAKKQELLKENIEKKLIKTTSKKRKNATNNTKPKRK